MGFFKWLARELRDMPASFPTAKERRYLKSLETREQLDDEQFYQQYYEHSGIPDDLVVGARAELQRILGYNIQALHPLDNIAVIFDDLDFSDVMYRMQRRFQIPLRFKDYAGKIDGTFDNMVRYIHQVRVSNA